MKRIVSLFAAILLAAISLTVSASKAEKTDKGCVIPDEVLAYTGVSDEGIMVYGAVGLGAILIGLMTVGFLRRRRTN